MFHNLNTHIAFIICIPHLETFSITMGQSVSDMGKKDLESRMGYIQDLALLCLGHLIAVSLILNKSSVSCECDMMIRASVFPNSE